MSTRPAEKSVRDIALYCPFEWEYLQEYKSAVQIISMLEKKLDELEQNDELLTLWTKFILNLIQCYEFSRIEKYQFSLSALSLCEEGLNKAKELYSETSMKICVMGKGLEHVILSCKYHITKISNTCEANALLETIAPIETLSRYDQASVWGVKSAIEMEYGSDGNRHAIESAKKALELHSDCGEWHFLYAKALSRHRSMMREPSFLTEINSFEKAVEYTGSLPAMELLAQSYIEYCRTFRKHHRACSLCMKATGLFRKVLEKGGNLVHVNIRCARGFMGLSGGFQDLKQAEQCILKALEKAPDNVLANHIAGTYYNKVKNLARAKWHLIKAGEGGSVRAYLELFTIKMQENADYNPLPELERLLHIFKERYQIDILLAELGIYAYDMNNDIDKAMEYWSRIISENPQSYMLKSYFSVCCRKLYEIQKIVNENKKNSIH